MQSISASSGHVQRGQKTAIIGEPTLLEQETDIVRDRLAWPSPLISGTSCTCIGYCVQYYTSVLVALRVCTFP
jgi:hypothetical protein